MSEIFDQLLKTSGEVGFVVRTLQWIVEVEGLPSVALGEMVQFENGFIGHVSALDGSVCEVMVLSSEAIQVGTRVSRTQAVSSVEVGTHLLGTTINTLGKQVRKWQTTQSTASNKDLRPLDKAPIGIVGRKKITQQLLTGMVMVDMMIPIGRGQRELVMGDRKTGKNYMLWHTMAAQAKEGTVCIYAAIGKKKAEIVRAEELLVSLGIADNCMIVAAALEESAGEIYLAPFTAMAVAEYFRDQGRHVLLILDDMTTHAKFYRELSLLSKKFPGRDSYPGDIFYVHSRLLERAGNFKLKKPDGSEGEASITCLPVVETVQGDLTGYVQTNMMSMTDGHIYFDSDLFFRGRRPAINSFVSVTRVGRQTQSGLARDTGRALYDLFNAYEKTQSFLRFGAELGENSRQVLGLGDKVLRFFNQPDFTVVPMELSIVSVGLLLSGLWDGKEILKLVKSYQTDANFKSKISSLAANSGSFSKLIEGLRKEAANLLPKLA